MAITHARSYQTNNDFEEIKKREKKANVMQKQSVARLVMVVQHVIELDLATVFPLCYGRFAQMSVIILDCF